MTPQFPTLAQPQETVRWAMISDHPYYPSIEYFATEQEARLAADQEIQDMHFNEGHHESSVSVACIISQAPIRTGY